MFVSQESETSGPSISDAGPTRGPAPPDWEFKQFDLEGLEDEEDPWADESSFHPDCRTLTAALEENSVSNKMSRTGIPHRLFVESQVSRGSTSSNNL